MIDAFTSFLDNYRSKIKNPLIGTIISVWLIHNWRIVYALFNFDKDCTMQERINFIEDYFFKKNFWLELFTVAGISFLVLLFTFLLLAISRFLTDGYYKIVEPFIMNMLDKNTIFTNADKNKLEITINELNSKIDLLRNANSKLENQNVYLLNRGNEIEKQYSDELKELSQKKLEISNSIELLQNKQIPANKVVRFFDDIINALNVEIKKEILIYIEHKKNNTKNEYRNFQGLKNELAKIGVIININGEEKTPALGILFLNYFEFHENNLPF